MIGLRGAAYAAIAVAWIRRLVQKVVPYTIRIEVPRKHRGTCYKGVLEGDTVYVIADGISATMRFALTSLFSREVCRKALFNGKVMNIDDGLIGNYSRVNGWPPSWSPAVCMAVKNAVESLMDALPDTIED